MPTEAPLLLCLTEVRISAWKRRLSRVRFLAQLPRTLWSGKYGSVLELIQMPRMIGGLPNLEAVSVSRWLVFFGQMKRS